MGNAQGDGLSHLATKTIHYNPSNLNARENVVTVTEFFFFFFLINTGRVWIKPIPYLKNSGNIHTLPS